MNCTEKEQETCQVEKMGCEGCAYNTSIDEENALKEIVQIEKILADFSKKFNFRYVITNQLKGSTNGIDYEDVNIKVYKELD